MTKKMQTAPLLLIDDVGPLEVMGDCAILTFESYGAEVRLSLTRNATCRLLAELPDVINALFAKQPTAELLKFGRAS